MSDSRRRPSGALRASFVGKEWCRDCASMWSVVQPHSAGATGPNRPDDRSRNRAPLISQTRSRSRTGRRSRQVEIPREHVAGVATVHLVPVATAATTAAAAIIFVAAIAFGGESRIVSIPYDNYAWVTG
jgi:hypothetical protein